MIRSDAAVTAEGPSGPGRVGQNLLPLDIEEADRWSAPGDDGLAQFVPATAVATGAARARGSWHTCPLCRRRVWVRPSEEAWWRTCSRSCAAARRRTPLLPWNSLQQRLVERIAESSLTLSGVATATGLSRATIRMWYLERGRYLTSASLSRVAAYLGMSYESALEAAGGKTGEEEMARTGRLNIATARPAPGTRRFVQARTRAGKSIRGRPHGPEWNARIRLGLIAAGAPSYGAAKLKAVQATQDGQARQRLWQWLRWHPHPTRDEVRAWARVIGARLNQRPGWVLAAWLPYLESRGLWSRAGRRANERRHAIVETLRERWPAGMHGSWDAAAILVSKADNYPIDGPALAQWWRDHKGGCTGLDAGAPHQDDQILIALLAMRTLTPDDVRRLRQGPAEILNLVVKGIAPGGRTKP